jgi:hypothetical protein
MKLPASETDIRKPNGAAPPQFKMSVQKSPMKKSEVLNHKAPRSVPKSVIKPAVKSNYLPIPSKEELVMADWAETMKATGNSEAAIKEFISKYLVGK